MALLVLGAPIAWAADASVRTDGHSGSVIEVLREVAGATGAEVTFTRESDRSLVVTHAEEGVELERFRRLARVLGQASASYVPEDLGNGLIAQRIDFGLAQDDARDRVASSLRALASAEGVKVTIAHPVTCDCSHPAWLILVGAPADVRLLAAVAEQLRGRHVQSW